MTEDKIKLGVKDIMLHVLRDDDQKRLLGYLSEVRGIPVGELIQRGILYVTDDLGELEYLSDETGISLEEMGITEDNEHMFLNGYIIPIRDIKGRIIWYQNYSFNRDKGTKYIMIFPDSYEGAQNIRMYGTHNYDKAMELDSIVAVEGIFDAIRLEMAGVPAVSLMGTKLTKSQQRFLSNFRRVYYVPDNDVSGEYASIRNQRLDNLVEYKLVSGYEDVDHLGKEGGYEYDMWLNVLKDKMGIDN